ncbi:hypothetical protein FACHB389_24345 [Nostoc calcicola FACHB-389]|nr:hypothetical protein [Nostoc calcicola FACHB-3891]OKH30195.1 hypothetical protein FACHB389_24345 [Nostoc calcicola FACHB-389]
MDKIAQNLLEQINFNLKNIALYLDKLTREEIQIDSNKIPIIDYSQYLWLNLPENNSLREQLEQYNIQSVNDIINDDFVEFCRRIYLQIEILLDQFIANEYGNDKIQNNSYSKWERLTYFFEVIKGGSEKFNKKSCEEYNIITFIMNIRDVASHGDWNGKSIEERIEGKGKSIKISLNLLKDNFTITEINEIFSLYVVNKKGVIIYDNLEKRTADIILYGLKDTFYNVEDVVNDIINNLSLLQYKLGNKVEVIPHRSQPQNKLKEFFDKKDYQKIHETIKWFIKEIVNYLTK